MLGNYLRNVLRDNRRLGSSQAIASQASDDAAEMNVSNEFQSFLETLQGDLVRAVREFAGRPPSSEAVVSPNESDPAASTSEASEINDSAPTVSEAIPAFHHQLGQNVRGMERTSGVTGGVDGAPRRLNFFRAHTFPEVPAGGAENDPNAVVPCIFIAVRSISHDPAFTTEDLVQHPSFPFIDGHVPSAGETGESDMNATSNSAADAIASTPTPAPRTFRQRVMSRLSSTRQPNRPTGPLNTYLVSVIGGNYPRSHPVLAIPNLLTGGPLTDEEMQLVGELMGPVKPLTATTAEIEKAGLRIIDGSETAELAEKGDLLSSCVERCLVRRHVLEWPS